MPEAQTEAKDKVAAPKKEAVAAPSSAETATNRFDEKTIKLIRQMRAEKNEAGKAKFSHAALAKEFKTTAGTISQIVRNRSYKDPDYKPVNDGV